MIAFLISAALLTLVVVALLVWPLLGARRPPAAVDRARLNARLLSDELAALERDHAAGVLGAEDLAAARQEINRRALAEVVPDAAAATGDGGRAPLTALAVALAVVVSGGLLYVLLGTPTAIDAPPAGAAAPQQGAAAAPPADVSKMVDTLAAKLAANPDNPAGWAMLGRSYAVLGRFADAVAAFRRIGPQLDNNAVWLSEYADALAMTANGNPVGEPERVALQALKLDPENTLALMLAGYAASQRGDRAAALPLLQRALRHVPPDSDDARFLKSLIKGA